jgi:NAD+ synthase/NAD+ synthase (glutamine-hydrolysing)
MKIALLQVNPTVGDLAGNARLILDALRIASAAGADLAATPELALVGYLPRDLLLSRGFVQRSWEALESLARDAADLAPVLVGLPEPNPSDEGRPLFNSAVLLRRGRVEQRFRKALLPTYDVFDEDRYFEPYHGAQLLDIAGTRVGISICEDIWNDRDFWKRRRYHHDPIDELAAAGASLVVNMSASPFTAGKHRRREEMLGSMAHKHRLPIAYVNQFGGNDDLVFDGRSSVFGADGAAIARGRAFDADVVVCDVAAARPIAPANDLDVESEIWRALVLGTRDYMRKCGFSSAVLGLSGGIDSALTAAIAVDAVGADHVLGVLMPSPYSSRGSLDDAHALAANLGIETMTLPIEPLMHTFNGVLREGLGTDPPGVAAENVQARIRGNLLMALSNTRGALLLTTGNKSELSVGYSTLYGDLAGGFALIKDVYKTDVFRLTRWLNERAGRELIPASIIERAPSAELRADQRDEDSLPPYPSLDKVLEAYVELDRSREELGQDGFDPEVVDRALAMIDRAEYKRRQAPPGVKLRPKAFGRDRRTPITNRWPG